MKTYPNPSVGLFCQECRMTPCNCKPNPAQFKQPIAKGESVVVGELQKFIADKIEKLKVPYETQNQPIINELISIKQKIFSLLEETTPPLSVNMPSDEEMKDIFNTVCPYDIPQFVSAFKEGFFSAVNYLRSQIKPSVPSKSIEECLNEVAKKYHYINFMTMIFSLSRGENFDIKAPQRIKEAMQLYLESNSQIKLPSVEQKEKFLIDSGIKAKGKIAVHYFDACFEWVGYQITKSKQVEKKDGEATICQHYYVDETINDIYVKKCLECGKIENHKP